MYDLQASCACAHEHTYVSVRRRILQHTVSSVATILPRLLRALSKDPVALGELGEALRGPCVRNLASHTSRAWDIEGKVSQLTSGDHQVRRTACISSIAALLYHFVC